MLAIFKKEVTIILKYVFKLLKAKTKSNSNSSSSKESKEQMHDESDAYFKWRHGIK